MFFFFFLKIFSIVLKKSETATVLELTILEFSAHIAVRVIESTLKSRLEIFPFPIILAEARTTLQPYTHEENRMERNFGIIYNRQSCINNLNFGIFVQSDVCRKTKVKGKLA